MKKKIVLGSTIALGVATVLGIFSIQNISRIRASDGALWYHYAEVAATSTRHGSRQFWANCSTHEFSLTLPDSDNIHEGVAFDTTIYFALLSSDDNRYIAPLDPIASVAGKTFVGADILEKDIPYYDAFLEVTMSATIEFFDETHWEQDSLKATSGEGQVTDAVTHVRGTYTQDEEKLSLQVSEYKNDDGENPQWIAIPPEHAPVFPVVIYENSLIMTSSTPSASGMLIFHTVFNLVTE